MYLSHGSGQNASLYEYARRGLVFCSYNIGVASLPAYTAKALGPLIYNGNVGSPQLKSVLIGVSITVTTASSAAVSVGIAWGTSIAPITTTASTLISSTYATNIQPTCSSYISGTVSTAPQGYLPLTSLDTTALTAESLSNLWIPLDGAIVIPQGSYAALVAGATASNSVLDVGLVWAEVKE